MGVAVRFLVATDSGRLVKIATAKIQRVWFRSDRLPEYAGQELKVLPVALEVDRREVLRVLHVLPYRTRLDANGRPDKEAERRSGMERLNRALGDQPMTTEERIARLQQDASYFWEPTEDQWKQAADLVGVRATDLKKRWRLPPE